MVVPAQRVGRAESSLAMSGLNLGLPFRVGLNWSGPIRCRMNSIKSSVHSPIDPCGMQHPIHTELPLAAHSAAFRAPSGSSRSTSLRLGEKGRESEKRKRRTFPWKQRIESVFESACNNLAQTRALRLGRLSAVDRLRTETKAPPQDPPVQYA